jgi:putative transposase
VPRAQYTAIRFTQRLHDAGVQPSMGSVGDSFDTALAETFFSILKVERTYRTSYQPREEAELDLVRYIDGWHNPHRIQRELGWPSPDEYEEAYYTAHPRQTSRNVIRVRAMSGGGRPAAALLPGWHRVQELVALQP